MDPNESRGAESPLSRHDCSAKIVQLLLTPDGPLWQGRLLGLGSDGVTYEVGEGTRWVPMIAPLGYQPNTKAEARHHV